MDAYHRERWQVEHTGELQRHRLLSCVVAEHALVMIDGLQAGSFKAAAMRKLVGIEQRWKELAQLQQSAGAAATNTTTTCVENVSNIFVHHLEQEAHLPWQPSDFSTISAACVAEHHVVRSVANQRLMPLSERHFDCYVRMLTQLARKIPGTEAWFDQAAHTISAAVALGTHLDWVIAMKKK